MSSVTSRSLAAGRVGILRSEWAWLALVSVGVALFYLAVHAPALATGEFTDPWIYTALMVNFKYIFHTFSATYYPSRLPWLIPGIVAHDLFGSATAFFVLHAAFFFAAGLFAYLTVRRFFGSTVALATYALLMASPLFYVAYLTDYPSGAVLTFLFGGIYFATTTRRARRPLLRAGASGFLFAAAVGTNLFSGFVVATLLLLYVVVRVVASADLRALAREVVAGLAGVLALVVVCGTFSKANGGDFLFFMPSIHNLSYINPANYKEHGYAWLYAEPQLLLPLFLLAALGVAHLSGWRAGRTDASRRFALGASLALGVFYAMLLVWEFVFGGYFLETWTYVSLFDVGLLLCTAAILAALWAPLEARGVPPAAFVAPVAAVAALPVLITYVVRLAPIGRGAAAVSLVLMTSVLLLLAGARRLRVSRLVTAVTLTLGFGFTLNYAGAGAAQTSAQFVRNSYPENRAVLSVAMQLIHFMRANGLQSDAPAFWYNPAADPNLNGIQSTYLWGLTWVGLDLPRIGESMRHRLAQRRPDHIVLLCKRADCDGGPAALAHAGYRPREIAQTLLSSGPERVWARAFTLGEYAGSEQQRKAAQTFYVPSQATFGSGPPAAAQRTWSFSTGAPEGWSGSSAAAADAARSKPFATSTSQYGYELVSPGMRLPAGSYAVYLRGKVLRGGLDLGVLDAGADRWIEQRLYWYGQRGFDTRWMVTPFRLSQPTTVQLVLSNWVPASEASRWRLQELQLVRTG